MNSSIYSADRSTHLRIVTVALVISIAIVGFAAARVGAVGAMQASEHPVQIEKAGAASREATAAPMEPRRI